MTSSIGVIGLGSIGKNLALNIQEKEKLHVFNKTHSKVVALEEHCLLYTSPSPRDA